MSAIQTTLCERWERERCLVWTTLRPGEGASPRIPKQISKTGRQRIFQTRQSSEARNTLIWSSADIALIKQRKFANSIFIKTEMKAISCPQCGALIIEVSKHQAITECGYCGAKVLMPRGGEYFLEIDEPDKKILPDENIKKSGTQIIWNSPFSDLSSYGETFEKKQKSNNP